MPRVRTLLIIGLTVSASLTGCSSDKKPTTSPTPTTAATSDALPTPSGTDTAQPPIPTSSATAVVDGCKLVTQADADQLTGLSLQPPTSSEDVCIYTAPTSGPTGQVEIYTGDKGEAQLASARAGSGTLTALSGIGDEAFITDFGVYFRKGEIWVAILLVKTEDAALSRAPLEALAKVAVGRL